MKLAELEKEIAKNHVRPAYLLLGAEPLLRDEALTRIRAAVLDPSSADFNLDRLHGESASAAALEDSLRVLPVMAARRLVILTEPEQPLCGLPFPFVRRFQQKDQLSLRCSNTFQPDVPLSLGPSRPKFLACHLGSSLL